MKLAGGTSSPATAVVAGCEGAKIVKRKETSMSNTHIIDEVPGLYRIIPLKVFRKTQNVTFDFVPVQLLPRIDAIDRVIHESNAVSPGPVGSVERPWYMHPCQDDNLVVVYGTRHVEIYTHAHGTIEKFTVTPHEIIRDGEIIYKGGAMLIWPRNVFHRIQSDAQGSASLNLAVHYEGFDIRTNFNIYHLEIATGEYKVIREGFLDQSPA
jgi:hypothetical protein